MGKDQKSETIIGPSVHVEGNFQGSGDIIVEGSVSGTLKTSGDIRVGNDARLKADLEGANVFVAGQVKGNVVSSGTLELTSSARISGNVDTQTLIVTGGAVLHGKCNMNGKKGGAEEEKMDEQGKAQPEKK
jgi:cytoskeletal protein CcmA (bactofilin family)